MLKKKYLKTFYELFMNHNFLVIKYKKTFIFIYYLINKNIGAVKMTQEMT